MPAEAAVHWPGFGVSGTEATGPWYWLRTILRGAKFAKALWSATRGTPRGARL